MRQVQKLDILYAGIVLGTAAVFGPSAYVANSDAADYDTLAASWSDYGEQDVADAFSRGADSQRMARDFFIAILAIDAAIAAAYIGLEIAGSRHDRRAALGQVAVQNQETA